MVRRYLVSWIQNPQSVMDTSTDPSRPVQQEGALAPMGPSETPKRLYFWAIVLTAVLCCLLVITAIVLGVLYDKESKKNYNPDLDSLLSAYHNVSTLYQRVSEANAQLQRENTDLTKNNTWLHAQNTHLTSNNTQLMWQNDNLTLENTEQRREIWNLTDASRRLRDKATNLTAYSEQLEGQNLNMSHTITLLQQENRNLTESNTRLQSDNWDLSDANIQLERENHNFSDANSFLGGCCETAKWNSTLLLKENQGLLEENTWLKHQNQNLTHQNAWLAMQGEVLMRANARLSLENANLLDDTLRLYQNYLSLDQYCPVVNAETQERLCKKCTGNWIIFQSKCYFFSGVKKTWRDSRAKCQSEGADLLIVNSVEEQKFAFRTSLSVNQAGTRVWIGLTDAQTEGQWHWVDGSPVTEDLQFWLSRTSEADEPDDWKATNSLGEDCGHLDTSVHELNSWMDAPCETAYRSICEKSV
ncbi:C-type lectin domain family 4 member F-like [Anguilla anguilla]|uniref:C-type lectin domain-containing protein n=1 Tax=Anguilla anguilla TaxID=7936 RepID=A0A9D3MU27_ANGAN|nr:C-type lectin domain family 4 member F-like [Anguilla anguilla]XP_035253514.1 C-type lectin domain family 4 member F-like [Anguilla anguilla]KAG5854979.1 hypothetical protein ANANG_G00043820 [Anguilla anguilla]